MQAMKKGNKQIVHFASIDRNSSMLTGMTRIPGASFTNSTRSLTESERNELIFKNHFLTILFPVDRFSEMGPSARTSFSDDRGRCSHRFKACRAASSKEMAELSGNVIFKQIL
ncbi:hypothetical protein V6N13_113236 [Hibiscus sabdariffa]|uniref:Uncharacterized protein n=1 Tax=Hibiscus sabdariffa TaxID=183260 RepID=A0ABR2CWJ8_9ROSI